jgi:hypothetical protein
VSKHRTSWGQKVITPIKYLNGRAVVGSYFFFNFKDEIYVYVAS